MTESLLVHLHLSFVTILKKISYGYDLSFFSKFILYYSIEKLKTIFNITCKHGDS